MSFVYPILKSQPFAGVSRVDIRVVKTWASHCGFGVVRNRNSSDLMKKLKGMDVDSNPTLELL